MPGYGGYVSESDGVMLQQQVIDDMASGLTITVWRTETGEGRLRIAGDALPFGAHDLQFSYEGEMVGAGTALVDACPTPLRLLR